MSRGNDWLAPTLAVLDDLIKKSDSFIKETNKEIRRSVSFRNPDAKLSSSPLNHTVQSIKFEEIERLTVLIKAEIVAGKH